MALRRHVRPRVRETGMRTGLVSGPHASTSLRTLLDRKVVRRRFARVIISGRVGRWRPFSTLGSRPPALQFGHQLLGLPGSHGPVAQLGERRPRMAEVRGSSPLGSTPEPPANSEEVRTSRFIAGSFVQQLCSNVGDEDSEPGMSSENCEVSRSLCRRELAVHGVWQLLGPLRMVPQAYGEEDNRYGFMGALHRMISDGYWDLEHLLQQFDRYLELVGPPESERISLVLKRLVDALRVGENPSEYAFDDLQALSKQNRERLSEIERGIAKAKGYLLALLDIS
jgi:hypothetical protein